MKCSLSVLHLTHGDLSSGAGKGAYLLHKGLLEAGINSKMLVSHRPVNESARGIEYLARGRMAKFIYRLRARAEFELKRRWDGDLVTNFSTGWLGSSVLRHRLVREADIIHLHWINSGFSSTAAIGRLRKPVVWTLRDMWPFTGGCHYALGCERFADACGRCPLFGARVERDRTRWIFRQKERNFAEIPHLYPVGISPWVAEEARRSSIFENREIEWIWNGVDLDEFPLLEQAHAREDLKLDQNGSYLALGAVDLRFPYKGFGLLREALLALAASPEWAHVRLLIFGRGGEELLSLFPGSRHFGVVRDNRILNKIYASADGFAAPSVQEAFGKTIVEALSSGTPVVCFNACGPRDMISHKQNGFKAVPGFSESFREGLSWTFRQRNNRDKAALDSWRQCCSNHARMFSHRSAAAHYGALYNRLIQSV